MKKRLVIVTINDSINYGNRLQNFALAVLLSKFGDVFTANCELSSDNAAERFLAPVKHFLFEIRAFFNELLSGIFPLIEKRRMFFSAFTKRFVDDSLYSVTVKNGLRPHDSINRIVLGSDQVWNYRWVSKRTLALRLGSFVPDDVPIISYAASFGVSEVSDEFKPIFQKYLPRLKAISVREDRAAELVKEMTGLDATVVLDPTLMLTAGQWKVITREFVPDDDRYVLTYFLGKPNDVQERAIQDYAKTSHCRVRRIFDLRDEETYVAGPQDFVELFQKAQYVFTDSYHACCFSVLFHKQFTVFNRAGTEGEASMNSRMETLFRLLGLDSVVIDEGLAPEIDYEKVDCLLAYHRAESEAWLDKAMGD